MKHNIRHLVKIVERALPHYQIYDDCDGQYFFYPGGMVPMEDVLPWLRKTLMKILLQQRLAVLKRELGPLVESNRHENWGPMNGWRAERMSYLRKRIKWFETINLDILEKDGLPKPWYNPYA